MRTVQALVALFVILGTFKLIIFLTSNLAILVLLLVLFIFIIVLANQRSGINRSNNDDQPVQRHSPIILREAGQLEDNQNEKEYNDNHYICKSIDDKPNCAKIESESHQTSEHQCVYGNGKTGCPHFIKSSYGCTSESSRSNCLCDIYREIDKYNYGSVTVRQYYRKNGTLVTSHRRNPRRK